MAVTRRRRRKEKGQVVVERPVWERVVYVVAARDLAREEVEMLKRKYGVRHVAVVKIKDVDRFVEQLRAAEERGIDAVHPVWKTPVLFVKKTGIPRREAEEVLRRGGYIVVNDY